MHTVNWDLVVFDEYHFGAWRDTAKELFEGEDEAVAKRETKLEYAAGLEDVNEDLAVLSERERQVLELRFGLLDGKDHTLEEVGLFFDVTRERIRQIESKALRKLRHPTRSRHLREYLA